MSKNFSYSLVATAPSPATSGTSLVVTAADGAIFPTVPFNATIWPANSRSLSTNAEVVTVTAISTDTLTIIRAQEGSTARTVIIGDQIAATLTAESIPTQGLLINKNATERSYTLLPSTDYMALDSFEIGSTQSIEIPSTSSLEIRAYAAPGAGAVLAPQLGKTVSAGNGPVITATGNYVVVGVGFQPRVIQIFATIANASNCCRSDGFYDRIAGTTGCVSTNAQTGAFGYASSSSVIISTQAAIATKQAEGTITATSSDGFTLNISTYGTVNTVFHWVAFA